MGETQFIFREAMKLLSLALLALFAAKAVASMRSQNAKAQAKKLGRTRLVLYAAVLALVGLGAWTVGYDVAAESYFWASSDNMEHRQSARTYINALRAVQLRPGNLRYWQALSTAKVHLYQFASALDDQPAYQAISGADLDEEDAYRFAVCHYFLGRYDKVISSTQRLINRNRYYAAPYVLQGAAYTAQKKYGEAERSFLAVLQINPSQQAAVEGLAHAYFLAGERRRALAVLDETAQYAFSPEARKRFEALKGLYDP